MCLWNSKTIGITCPKQKPFKKWRSEILFCFARMFDLQHVSFLLLSCERRPKVKDQIIERGESKERSRATCSRPWVRRWNPTRSRLVIYPCPRCFQKTEPTATSAKKRVKKTGAASDFTWRLETPKQCKDKVACVCVFVCLFMFFRGFVFVFLWVCVFLWLCFCVCVFVGLCFYVCVFVCLCFCGFLFVCLSFGLFVFMFLCLCFCGFVFVCLSFGLFVFMFLCLCFCVCGFAFVGLCFCVFVVSEWVSEWVSECVCVCVFLRLCFRVFAFLKRPVQCAEQFLELKICVSLQFRAIDPANPARGFSQQNENVHLTAFDVDGYKVLHLPRKLPCPRTDNAGLSPGNIPDQRKVRELPL